MDVFSWGATVAFAATGQSPFGEGRPDAVIYRVVHEEPDLSGVDPKLLPNLKVATATRDERPVEVHLLVACAISVLLRSVQPG